MQENEQTPRGALLLTLVFLALLILGWGIVYIDLVWGR